MAAAQTGARGLHVAPERRPRLLAQGQRRPGEPGDRRTGAAAIQGTGGAARAATATRCSAPVDETARTGIVRLQVTGTAAPAPGRPVATRTLTATLRPRTFLDFAYLSDVEVIDPALIGSDPACANYGVRAVLAGRPRLPPIIWKAGDNVDGPVHSNDVFTIDPAVDFGTRRRSRAGRRSTGRPQRGSTWLGSASVRAGHKPLLRAHAPAARPGNTELTEYVEPGRGRRRGPGSRLHYSGATRIIFQGTTMRVFSPRPSRSRHAGPRCLDVASRGWNRSSRSLR